MSVYNREDVVPIEGVVLQVMDGLLLCGVLIVVRDRGTYSVGWMREIQCLQSINCAMIFMQLDPVNSDYTMDPALSVLGTPRIILIVEDYWIRFCPKLVTIPSMRRQCLGQLLDDLLYLQVEEMESYRVSGFRTEHGHQRTPRPIPTIARKGSCL